MACQSMRANPSRAARNCSGTSSMQAVFGRPPVVSQKIGRNAEQIAPVIHLAALRPRRAQEAQVAFLHQIVGQRRGSPKPASDTPAAPGRSAGRTRQRHRCPWAARQLATPREPPHSGWHIPRSYRVSSWLLPEPAHFRAAAWIRQQSDLFSSPLPASVRDAGPAPR